MTMRLINILAGVTYLCSSVISASDQSPEFHNSARHAGADPYVIYNSPDGLYYAYSTEGADEGYHFAIYSSPDLSTWHRHSGGVLKACYDEQMNPIEGGQACWARDWFWAPEVYHNEKTGWYFFFFAGRLREDLTKSYFRYSSFEEPSKLGVVVSRSPTGPWREIKPEPIGYYPFDPNYHDVNLIMDEKQMLPPQSLEEGESAPKGTYIPTIDVNIFFDNDDRIYLYASRNAYRNWNWDQKLGKYIEESNIIVVELQRSWWDDPSASMMPEITAEQIDIHAKDAPELPINITSYNGTGEVSEPPRKDGWKTAISYGADPQEWENYHVNDYEAFNGTKKDRRWSEGSTLVKRSSKDGKPIYLILYSANNFEASNYGVGFATAESPLGPFRKSSDNPVLSQITDGEIPIFSTGHGSVVASPPRDITEKVGAQDVTLRTPEGSELFYIHHGRNDPTQDRAIFSTRMTLDESAVYFGSNNAISMHLTPADQLLPKNTYPIAIHSRYSMSNASGKEFIVRVSSAQNSAFDLQEGSNRVVSLPGEEEAISIKDGAEDGTFVFGYKNDNASALAYQRIDVHGIWSTVVSKRLRCN
ncbi:Arabinanase/levansucrase/invertase [Thozetella sp. PMI_491]|nr:Arabinanase/levansucrase/invertase [Thozetella sp. PMI_491]